MTRVPRLSLYALLVLMQLLAPWVHAHTGTETGGFLHLPGLESLAKSGEAHAAAGLQAGMADLIVGVQVGVPNDGQGVRFPPDGRHDQPRLFTAFLALAPPPRCAGYPAPVETPSSRFRFSRHDFASRAPPFCPL